MTAAEIVKTLTELADGFERLTDTQAMDTALFIYEWEPPWFWAPSSHKWGWQSTEAQEEFKARVIDTLYALRTAATVVEDEYA